MSAHVGEFLTGTPGRMPVEEQIKIVERHLDQAARAKRGLGSVNHHIVAFETGWTADTVAAVVMAFYRRADWFQSMTVTRRVKPRRSAS